MHVKIEYFYIFMIFPKFTGFVSRNIITFIVCLIPIFVTAIITFSYHFPEKYRKHTIDLTGSWKIHEGTNDAWTGPDVRDAGWKDFNFPGSYYDQGFRDIHATIRKSFTLNENLKDKDLFFTIGITSGLMGAIAMNGHMIGETGYIVNNKKTHENNGFYGFFINREFLFQDKTNVLALQLENETPGYDDLVDPRTLLGNAEYLKPYYENCRFVYSFFQYGISLAGLVILIILMLLTITEWTSPDRYKYLSAMVLVFSAFLFNLVFSTSFLRYFADFRLLSRLLLSSISFIAVASLYFLQWYFLKKTNLITKISHVICISVIISYFLIGDFEVINDIYKYFIGYFFLLIIYMCAISVRGTVLSKSRREGIIITACFIIASLSGISDFLTDLHLIDMPYIFNVNISIVILIASTVIIAQFANISLTNRTLAAELQKLNYSLENKVAQRTAELSEAYEKLKSLDHAKNEFFSNISHEFRTPLTLLLGPVDSILAGEYGQALRRDHEIFSVMRTNIIRLLKLINNLLDFSRIDAGKMQPRKVGTDVSSLLEFFASSVESSAKSRGISFVYDDRTEGINAVLDPDLFEKAVFNLISNSFKFTPPGGTVILQLDARIPEDGKEGTFSVSVKDTGIGIPEDKLDYIFERFAQVDSSVSRKFEGAGIGLALAKEIAEMHKGRISVKSAEGKGACFIMTFPYKDSIETKDNEPEDFAVREWNLADIAMMSDAPPLPAADLNPGSPPDSKPEILVVEDNSGMRQFLSGILSPDYGVHTAENGKLGLELALRVKPDLVLADVMMPVMDGYEMTARIKSEPSLKGIPVILLTAKADEKMKLEGFEKGADDYVIKPFSSPELHARIRACLEMKRLRDEAFQRQAMLEKTLKDRDAAQKRFQETAELLPGAIIETDTGGRITFINRAGREMLGYSGAGDLPYAAFPDFISVIDRERWKTETAGKDTDLKPYRLRRKDSSETVVLLKFCSFKERKGFAGMRIIAINVRPFFESLRKPDEIFFEPYGLTKREKQSIELVISGLSNRDIEEKLCISKDSLRVYLKNAYDKMGISGEGRGGLEKLLREHNRKRYGFGDFLEEFIN